MKRNLLNIAYLAFLVLAPAACTKVPAVQGSDGTKSPIELSVGLEGVVDEPATKATVVTDGTSNLTDFASGTRVFLIMKAKDESSAHRPDKTAMTYGDIAQDKKITFADDVPGGYHMYWDDAYARDTKLSVYGLAINGQKRGNFVIGTESNKYNYGGGNQDGTQYRTYPWASTGVPEYKTEWSVGDPSSSYTTQSKNSFEWQDLCFSNNIADNGTGKDKRLYFDPSTRKFTAGDMIFYHALSKITVEIWAGEGFTVTGGNDFKFVPVTGSVDNNFELKGFYGSGIFDIVDGTFETLTDANKKDYSSIYLSKTGRSDKATKPVYTLNAYVIPGTDIETTVKSDAMAFTIDNNRYEISTAMLYEALKEKTSNYVLQAGVEYVFKFTVGKTRIEKLTAQVVEWETVNAKEITPKANTVTITTKTVSSTDHSEDFDLYRLPYVNTGSTIDMSIKDYSWTGRYTDKATLTQASDYSTTYMWKTNWYYESNKTFYHFRTVSPAGTDVVNGSENSETDDFVVLNSSPVVTSPAQNYTDILWGAPFEAATGSENKYGYGPASKGFDGTTQTHQIHYGITTTESPVNILLFHMMSDVTFNITTTTDADKVELHNSTEDTTVELIDYHTQGRVLMGNGLVKVVSDSKSTSSSPAAIDMEAHTPETDSDHPAKSVYRYGAVPQSLENVVLRITTPDDNRYEVALKNIAAPSVTTSNLAYPYTDKISSWYPGFKYTYTLKLKKTGIEKITATVVDWETVEAGSQDVQIK